MRTDLRSSGSLGVIVAFALAAGACNGGQVTVHDRTPRTSDAYPLGPGCEAQPDPHCSNPVNRVMIQMLRGSNLPIADEGKNELCRRMAIDLIGRVPSPDESTWCEGATPEQMANYFMGTNEYVVQQARAWGDKFYNLDEQWYLYVVEIDELVRKVYRDEIRYDDFMTRFLVHPGFYARFQGDDWSSNVVRYALGRPARADEVEAMRPLVRVWDSRYFCDGIVWYNAFQDNGGREDNADSSCGRTEWALNFCNCMDDQGRALCVSNAFGTPVDFGTTGCADYMERGNERNLLRVTQVAAGRVAICPDGSNQSQCADRRFGDMGGVEGQLMRLGSADGGQTDRMYNLGRVLSARQDFWEAAVDREIRRFLSWWQNGLRRPDYDIPDVRRVLTQQLQQTRSLRQLQYNIVTSLLYTQPSELPEGAPEPAPGDPIPPVWSFGPTRVLTGERWLDSAQLAAWGFRTGNCDYRFVSNNSDWSRLVDRRLVDPTPNPDYEVAGNYRGWAQALGGCSASQARPVTSTLAVASAQNFLAEKLCANATLKPNDMYNQYDYTPENMGFWFTWLYRRALGRDPSDAELTQMYNEAIECKRAGVEACEYLDAWEHWTCSRIIDSAEFAIY